MLDEMASDSIEPGVVVASSTASVTPIAPVAGSEQAQQQGQPQPLQQRLHNECLILIIQHLRHDLVQLHKLLFVNRFFYIAALPHLYRAAMPYFFHNPSHYWSPWERKPDLNIDREKLLAIMLASFFEARVLSRRKRDLSLLEQESEQDDGRDAKLVDAVLRPFGLRVTAGALKIPSMRRFLIPAAATESISRKQSATNNGVMDDVVRESDRLESTQLPNAADEEIEEDELGSWGYPMTVNYSWYLTELSTLSKADLQLSNVLRLRRMPAEFSDPWLYPSVNINDVIIAEEANAQEPSHETTVDGSSTAVMTSSSSLDPAEESSDDDSDDGMEHAMEEQLADVYKARLADAVESLLLHYNFDHITSFAFHMSKAVSYLALAPNMDKLQRLKLCREAAMPSNYMNGTVLFIQRNQAAFPRKPRLDLEFLYGWSVFSMDEDFEDDDGENPLYLAGLDLAAVEALQLSKIRTIRENFFRYMKHKITLYEAVGQPKAIHVGKLPLFYEHSHEINLDGLLAFDDSEMGRIVHGEGPAMEAFFRRCKSLRELKLRVDSHTLFSKAAAEAMRATGLSPVTLGMLASRPGTLDASSTGLISLIQGHNNQSSSLGILKHLQTLNLHSTQPYRFAIHALNDAMVAFADSLQNVKLNSIHTFPGPRITTTEEVALYRNPVHMRSSRRSLRLYTVPWANTIGDWPRPLPQLRTLSVSLWHVASVEIGSLDQCPNLRKLKIRFGNVGQVDIRTGDIDVVIGTNQEETELPSDLESMRQLMDMRYQQSDFNLALFPKWNLPRLQVLVLIDLPALRFDFESLETMPNLVELRLTVSKTVSALQSVHEFQSLQNAAWEQKRSQRGRAISKRWSLPALKTVTIEGLSATMFYLDWLKGCPNLESLTLKSTEEYQHLKRRPFFWGSETGQESRSNRDRDHEHDDSTEKDKSIDCGTNDEDGHGEDDDDDTPFWGSQLVKFELQGSWIMSEEDLIILLTIYAPFLKTFHVDRLSDSKSLSGRTFLGAFQRADEINAEYAPTRRELEGAETISETVEGKPDNGKDTRVPGQALTSVKAKYTISKRDRLVLGFVPIESDEV
ncbi:hypothetical protein BGZ99_007526, partial [Dissophora globulifera]